jgi:predicted amidohydrolase
MNDESELFIHRSSFILHPLSFLESPMPRSTLLGVLMTCCLAPAVTLAAGPAPVKARPKTVKVAAVQCSSDLGDVAGNRKKFTALVTEAARNGARIVVLPETAITGYLSQDLKTNWHLKGKPIDPTFTGKDPAKYAETVPGPSTKHFAALAKKLDIYLTVPLLEVVPPDDPRKGAPRYFNTVCLASPQGKIVAHYRKLTPWPVPEKSWATAGDRGVQVYETEYGKVGLAICFDIHTVLSVNGSHIKRLDDSLPSP